MSLCMSSPISSNTITVASSGGFWTEHCPIGGSGKLGLSLDGKRSLLSESNVRTFVAGGDDMSFSLWFDDVCGEPARVALQRVQQAEKTPVGELRIYDLLRDGDRLLRWGVYFFYSQHGECLYVGKNSTQKFVERIPIHFCLEPNTWMNHLVKKIQKHEALPCLTDASEAARGHTLLLMPVSEKEQRTWLAALEKFFRLFAAPKYNALRRRNRHNSINLDAPLLDVLKRL